MPTSTLVREHLAEQPVAPQTQADTHVAVPKARPPWPVAAWPSGWGSARRRGECSSRYGHVLKSRALVGVRGAGDAFDGLHYVSSVTSTLKRGDFTQAFSLARNALLSTVPNVPS